MMIHRLLPLLVLISLCLTACNSFEPQRETINAGAIVNATGQTIEDVRLVHEPTKKVAATAYILAGQSMDVGFERGKMRATHATITWTDARGRKHLRNLILPAPSHDTDTPKKIIYTISPDGGASVQMISNVEGL